MFILSKYFHDSSKFSHLIIAKVVPNGVIIEKSQLGKFTVGCLKFSDQNVYPNIETLVQQSPELNGFEPAGLIVQKRTIRSEIRLKFQVAPLKSPEVVSFQF